MFWENHDEIQIVKWIQAKSIVDEGDKETYDSSEEGAVADEKASESEEQSGEEIEVNSENETVIQVNKFSVLNDE